MAKRDQEWQLLFDRAHEAGMKAGQEIIPTPMVVYERAHPMGDLLGMSDEDNPVTRVYEPVMDGPCGFAWVTVRPGTSSFARWLKKNQRRAHKGYYGGIEFSVWEFGQSMMRKEAYASAFAEVLREAGLDAYSGSRMD